MTTAEDFIRRHRLDDLVQKLDLNVKRAIVSPLDGEMSKFDKLRKRLYHADDIGSKMQASQCMIDAHKLFSSGCLQESEKNTIFAIGKLMNKKHGWVK